MVVINELLIEVLYKPQFACVMIAFMLFVHCHVDWLGTSI